MDVKRAIELESRYIFPTYKRTEVVLVRGQGAKVWDVEDREYLDFLAGLAVCNLGHCHPSVVEAIRNQSEQLLHTSNLYYTIPQIELARLISENSLGGRVFFCNSGAEANEAAIKLARRFGKKKGSGCFEVITMTNSFHGRTLCTLTATAQRKFQNGFEPLPSGFTYANFNDLQDVKEKVSDRTCAIMVEPIQGESGVWPANQSFLSGLRDLCDKKKVLLIFDEVQTGFGRTGKLFSYEHHGIMPDVMTLAKALGGGMAIGAMVARSEFSDLLDQGSHASTFGGNPLACAVAKVSLETILNDGLCERSRKMGAFLIEKLSGLREKHDLIEEIRGKGLMIGVDLKYGRASEIVELCTKKGLLINATSENTLRFLPPLTITRDEINHAVSILDDVFSRL